MCPACKQDIKKFAITKTLTAGVLNMQKSKIVKLRYNRGNQDSSLGIPTEYKDALGDAQFFECELSHNVLMYRIVNMSGSAEVVDTKALPQASHRPCGDDCD